MAMDPRPQTPRPEERTNSLCELREALVIVAALVGQADGRIDPVEREPLIEAIERNRLPSIFNTEANPSTRLGSRVSQDRRRRPRISV
jgi:tellurite resistance protein